MDTMCLINGHFFVFYNLIDNRKTHKNNVFYFYGTKIAQLQLYNSA